MKIKKYTTTHGEDGKSTRWVVSGVIDGKQVRRKIPGTHPRMSKAEIEPLAFEFWKQLLKAKGHRVGGGRDILTLEALLKWDRERAGIREATRKIAKERSTPLLRILGRTKRVEELRAQDIEKYKKKREKEKAHNRTVNLELYHTLKPALTRAVESGKIEAEPVKITKLPEKQKDIRRLMPGEAKKLLQAIEDCPKIRNKTDARETITLLLYTGVRRGELMGDRNAKKSYLGFPWKQVDFERRSITIESRKRGGGETYKTRTIPMTESVYKALSARMKRNKGKASDPAFRYQQRLRYWIKNAAEHAKLRDPGNLTPHSLRHTFATLALQNGATVADVAELLGDSIEVVARYYLHADRDSMRATVASIEGEIQHGNSTAKTG